MEASRYRHYLAWMLEALSRFGHEGLHLQAHRRFALLRRWKPVWRLLSATAARMAALGLRPAQPQVLEFGVWKGRSIRMLARLFTDGRLTGFDTFSGFPDDGRTDWQQDFRVRRLPRVPAQVELVVGRFEDTLAPFLQRHDPEPIALVHVDCDLFSATRTVLETLGSRLGPGSVLVFDELLHYDGFADNELLALYLFLQQHGLDFEWFVTIGDVFPLDRWWAGEQPAGGFVGFRNNSCYQNAALVLRPASAERAAAIERFMAPAAALAALRPAQSLPAPR